MNIYELLFIMQLFLALGITLLKVYNLMNKSNSYDLKFSFILLLSFFFCWIIGFVIAALNPEREIFILLWGFETRFLILNVLFFMIELFISLSRSSKTIVSTYSSKEANTQQKG